MQSKSGVGRRFAHGLAALAIAGMTLPAQAQSPYVVQQSADAYARASHHALYGYGNTQPYVQPGYAYAHRGYGYAHPGYGYAHRGYGYAHPGYGYPAYSYGYPAYGYPYYYRKKRNNGAAIAAAAIGGMALGAILSSQARHPRKAYYKRRYH